MAILASDTFTRANETPMASPWVRAHTTRDFNLASNAATPGSLALDTCFRYSGVTFPNDQYAQVTCTVTGTGANTGPGCAVRIDTGTTGNYYRTVVNKAGSNNLTSTKLVAGAATLLAQRTITFVDGHTVRIQVSGTTLGIYYDGVLQGATFTDAAHSAGAGGLAYSSTATAATVDNFEAGDLTTTGNIRAEMLHHHG